jgi:deferrochelatase/peroxidase EfeB
MIFCEAKCEVRAHLWARRSLNFGRKVPALTLFVEKNEGQYFCTYLFVQAICVKYSDEVRILS